MYSWWYDGVCCSDKISQKGLFIVRYPRPFQHCPIRVSTRLGPKLPCTCADIFCASDPFTAAPLVPFRCDHEQVQYILCIRPNMENNPVLFEDEYVTQQLLSASIVEAAQVCLCLSVCLSVCMRAQVAAVFLPRRGWLCITRLFRAPSPLEARTPPGYVLSMPAK